MPTKATMDIGGIPSFFQIATKIGFVCARRSVEETAGRKCVRSIANTGLSAFSLASPFAMVRVKSFVAGKESTGTSVEGGIVEE